MLSAVQLLFTGLCVALVALFFVVCCVPWFHTPVRARLRPLAIILVESGLDVVLAAQRYQSPLLTSLFTKSSHTVSVSFYASFLPLLFWMGLPELGRNLVFLMCMSMYVGNAIKDLVCAPRPMGIRYGREKLKFLGASNEEVELNAKEYGLPSSHTLNSLCLNYMIVWYLHDRQLITASLAAVLYAVVFVWVLWIAASRLYLGLHTPVDILAGAVAGLAVLVCFIAVEEHLTRWVFAGPQALLHAALAALVLLRLYPRPLAHTPSYEFTVSFMGAMFGIVVGVAGMAPAAHQPGVQLAHLWAGGHSKLAGSRLLWAARRLGVGFLCVAVLKEASRAALLAALPLLYRFFPLSIRRLWQPPMHNLAKPAAAAPAGQRQQRRGGRARQQAQNGEQPDGGLAAEEAAAGAAAAAAEIDPRLAALPHNSKGLPWDVDVTSRFFAYAALGAAVAGVVPHLLQVLQW